MAKPDYFYNATLHKVIDGDTIDVLVDLGFRVTLKVRIRLARINTAELVGSPGLQRDRAVLAKQHLANSIGNSPLKVRSLSIDKYGRSIAEVYLPDDRNLSDLMLEANMADNYFSPARPV